MSKGLEALKELKVSLISEGAFDYVNEERIITIEKELKALEIIKNKQVNIFRFISLCIIQKMPVSIYNAVYSDEYTLTQEEYELLKEVLL